ncbi:MAG: DUF3795 domain-containing protein [Lachnospiraceae bacterium]|nr:DUF3795 domain-containing protein [Lachnospiraceae bacterium]
MVESRCGLTCSGCPYREQMGCKGCVNIEKPFWGESCPVSSCCGTKGHEHCGQCESFPCDLLKQFAFDEEQGDNGQRIEQCRRWAEG